MPKQYAGIGSRQLTQDEWNFCYHAGLWLAEQGWTLRTGACKGADQAFAEGAIAGGGPVVLCLPWPSYEFKWVEPMLGRGATRKVLMFPEYDDAHKAYYASVDEFHPAPHRLSDTVRKLHARNAMILDEGSFVLAWPKVGARGGLGGTGQGIRIAQAAQVPVIRLDLPLERARVEVKIGRRL